ncbi:hypothetical protein GLYMA_18G176950v4 [Glycine max]|nr:hypothetical protein GLYMA_18G176950v4 [Glycine max]KAH1154958.1 hypothetical protein GYH30_050302 [Glycine max]
MRLARVLLTTQLWLLSLNMKFHHILFTQQLQSRSFHSSSPSSLPLMTLLSQQTSPTSFIA